MWPAEQFDLATELQGSAEILAEEVSKLRNDRSRWKPVGWHTGKRDQTIIQQGTWVDVLLFKQGKFHKGNCAKLPEACALVKRHPEITTNPGGLALISELWPGTEVLEHQGETNAQLTFQLALKVPGNSSGIRVGGLESAWNEGQVLVFDDSFPHSVWHHGSQNSGPRTVLLLRAWHPGLSPDERYVGLQANQEGKQTWQDADLYAASRYLRTKEATKRWKDQEARLQQAAALRTREV